MLAAFVSAAVALSVLLRGRKPLVNRLFVAFAANLFVHFLASFLHRFSSSDVWLRVDMFAATLLPVTSLLFFGHFLWKDAEVIKPYLRLLLVLSSLGLVVLFTPLGAQPATVAVMVGYVFVGLYLCAWMVHMRREEMTSQREKTRLRILQVVMLVAVTFVLLGMLPGPLGFLRTWGDLVSLFFLYFLGQSLLKYRLLDIQELLGRGLVLIAIALILAIVFGLLVLLAGASPAVSLFHTFVASFIILILFEPLRDKVEGSAGLLLFRERFELKRKLEQLRRDIANIIDLDEMTRFMLDTLYEDLRFNGASIYLQEEGGTGYLRRDFRGPQPPERIDVNAHRAFFEQLGETPTVVLAETFERVLAEQDVLPGVEPSAAVKHAGQVLATLSHLRAGICVPLVSQGNILGLWNILDETGTASYSTEEIARLMAVGEQAAINIENSKMFERIRERDRLAVLGEMAAGLAHEIRNPLGAIKGAAQYLDPAAAGSEAAEFLHIIIEESDRLNGVVNQFLDYARPLKLQLEQVDANRLVEHAGKLFAASGQHQDIEVSLQLVDDLPPVPANPQQLTQVLLNLLSNAAEAMAGKGRIVIKTRHLPATEYRRQGTIEIEVTDNGPGIPPEVRQNIFIPFFTTKEGGTGLGLAISQRIVEHHGGWLRVRSAPRAGASFTITLPTPALERGQQTSPTGKRDDLPFSTSHSTEKP